MAGKIYIIYVLFLLSILRFCQMEGNLNNQQCVNYNEKCDLQSLRPCCDGSLSCNYKSSQNSYVCRPKKKLSSQCKVDEDCSAIVHAKCSSELKCVCREKNIEFNETSCMPLVGGFCWKNETCATDNAICVDNQCKCRDYYKQNGEFCFPITANRPCLNNMDCVSLKWSECSKKGACTCQPNTLPVKDTCVPQLDVHCNLDTDCRVKNSKCTYNTCQCKKNFIFRPSECVPKYLFESCEKDADCDLIPFAECSIEEKCKCKQDFIATDDRTCKPLLGEACADDEDCQALNSKCDDNECVCRKDYMKQSINSCIPTHLGQFCREDNDCNQIMNAECFNQECVCKSGYHSTNPMTCLLSLGRQCTKLSDCAPDNAACYGGICDCDEYFISKSDDECLPTLLEKKCRYLFDCRNEQFSFCTENKICACSFNYVAFNGTECKPLLGGECNNTNQCMVDNSICFNNQCRCKHDFIKSSHTHCVPNRLGAACKKDSDCINVKNSKCINGECNCSNNHLESNSTLCAALLEEVCEENGDCFVKNSICIDEKCQCKPNYLQSSNSRCGLVVLGRSCTKHNQCNMTQNSICVSNTCVCRRNHFAYDRIFCIPVQDQVCSKNNQCSGDFFHCSNNKCQCKSGFTAVSVDQCVRTNSLYSCRDETECSDIWHSTCSTEKCVCRSYNIAVGNSTCLPILRGYCWRDDQCKAENSVCSDYRCECKPGFIEVAINSCAPIIL